MAEEVQQNSIQYLYGVSKATWLNLRYSEAFMLKNHLANRLIKELQEVHWSQRDSVRINKILKAIKYNEARLKE